MLKYLSDFDIVYVLLDVCSDFEIIFLVNMVLFIFGILSFDVSEDR